MQIQFFDIIGIFFGTVVVVLLFVLSKGDGFSLGMKILRLSWEVFLKNKSVYFWHMLLTFLNLIILPAICLLLFFNFNAVLSFLMGPDGSFSAPELISSETLYALFILVVMIFWITMPFWFFLAVIPSVITFLNVVFYRKLFNSILAEEGTCSYAGIFRSELGNFSGALRLSMQIMWIRYYVHRALFKMRRQFLFSPEADVSFSQYLSIAMVSNLMNYASIDYACYRSLPKHAVAKSYMINRRYSSAGLFGIIFKIAFVLSMFALYIFLCQVIFILGSDYVGLPDQYAFLIYWIAAMPFILVGTVMSMFLQTYYLILYIKYNNSRVVEKEGADAGSFAVGEFDRYFDYVEDFLARKLNIENIPSYEKRMSLKDEYRVFADAV